MAVRIELSIDGRIAAVVETDSQAWMLATGAMYDSESHMAFDGCEALRA